MKYKFMDQQELKIADIKNLENIYLYDILDPKTTTDKSLLGMIVMYDGNKSINYCQTDRYFEDFLKKVMVQYCLEKEQSSIIIDDEAKALLEDNFVKQSAVIANFNELSGFELSKLKYDQQNMTAVKNVMFYELQQIAQFVGDKVVSFDKITGYRDFFQLEGERGNDHVNYPLLYSQPDDFTYQFQVGNFFQPGVGISLAVNYAADKTTIYWQSENQKLSGYHELFYTPLVPYETNTIYQDGTCIFANTNPLSTAVKEEDIKKLHSCNKIFGLSLDESDIIVLPWHDYHLRTINKEQLSQQQNKTVVNHVDLTIGEDQAYAIQQQTSTIQSLIKKYEVKTEGMKRRQHVILKTTPTSNYGIIENRFYPFSCAMSEYKNHLENKNFYHYFLTPEQRLQDIDDVMIEPFSSLKEKDLGYQLLSPYQFQKIIKRGEK